MQKEPLISQNKKHRRWGAWNNLLGQIDDLTTAKPEIVRQLLTDLVLPPIDRIRLFASQAGAQEMVREIAIPSTKMDRATLTRKGLREIDDLEIAVALTLQEDGTTISFGVASEPALLGRLREVAGQMESDGGPLLKARRKSMRLYRRQAQEHAQQEAGMKQG
ncbi:MAG: hypothetical protein OXC63_10580, partial [Aestuariivita sp.]|nr:hypothetical protein [Aestuariivita sp.]